MYHISDLKKFTKCNRLYFLEKDNNLTFKPFLRSDESYIDLLKDKLRIANCFTGKTGDNNKEFFDNVNKFDWFVNTRFENDGLRIKIPILHKINDIEFDVYFIYFATQIKELDLFSYRICVEILDKLNVIVKNINVAYVNPYYVYHNKLESDNLFIITDRYNGKSIIDIVLDGVVDYKKIINEIEFNSLDSTTPKKVRMCHLYNNCSYYNDCFKDENDLPCDSMLTLVSSQYKNEMYNDGLAKLKDVDLDKLEGNRVQYAQILACNNNGLFCDKLSLSMWLKDVVKKPISFIDFEWDRYLIPNYENMKPLDVIPFEFALYIDDGEGELKHKVFISSGDCREEFIKELIASLPKEGTIFAYNANGAEVLRIKELIVEFPKYKDVLEKIIERFVDLAIPFTEGLIYDTRMAGNYSLKKLVSIVSDKSYQDLDIDEGMQAVYSWRDIDNGNDTNEEKTIDDLKKYCSLDAYGLYLVYKWLLSLV